MKYKVTALFAAFCLLLSGCGSLAKVEARPDTSEVAVEPVPAPEPEEEPSPVLEPEPEPTPEPEPVPEESESEPAEEESSEAKPTPDAPPSEKPAMKDVYPITDQQVLDVLSRPIEEIDALDNTAIGWGPGPTSGEVRPAAPIQLQETYGQYGAHFIAPDTPEIFLTFDEGYDAGYNSAILDTLRDKQIPALFFVTLGFVQSRPDLVQRMVDEGHMLGNHSWKHIAFPSMDLMDCAKDVLYLHQYVEENFGYTMTVCRPPEGAFSIRTLALLDALGYQSMFWSFAYRDWLLDEQPSQADGLQTIVGRSHPGAIYLLHAVSSTNAAVLADAIDQLQGKGYQFTQWHA